MIVKRLTNSTISFPRSALQTFEIVASREDFPASRAASAPGLYDVVRGLTPTGSPISVAGEIRAKLKAVLLEDSKTEIRPHAEHPSRINAWQCRVNHLGIECDVE